MDNRPILNKSISTKDFQDFYWLKKELSKFCKEESLGSTGSKVELSNRILLYLKTGKTQIVTPKKKVKPNSMFDWHKESLRLNTIITDNYKNTQNARRFFIDQIGNHFKFNVKFMNWMKSNSGKTLKDAVNAWKRIKIESKNSSGKKDIAAQFEYNKYLRDFLAANPNSNRAIGIRLWNIKKTRRGDNVYRSDDLELID